MGRDVSSFFWGIVATGILVLLSYLVFLDHSREQFPRSIATRHEQRPSPGAQILATDTTVVVRDPESHTGLGEDCGNRASHHMSADELRKAMPVNVVCPRNPEQYGPVAMEKMECKKRLPNIIGIGVAKCGTAAISFFLQNHPYLVHSDPMEVFFWSRHVHKGLDYYRNLMPVSSKYQVTMEKTPSYFWNQAVAKNISKLMSEDTKFIVVVRDPIDRTLSEWIHIRAKIATFKKMVFSDHPLRPEEPNRCYLNTTFEHAVLRPDGEVMDNNCLVRNSHYARSLQMWMDLFPRDRFLVLDGDEFIANPLPALKTLEDFIGLPRYFDETKVEFNEEKGFYCLAGLKQKAACMSSGKGRAHPEVDEKVVAKLKKHFHPYNKELEEMTGVKFSWS